MAIVGHFFKPKYHRVEARFDSTMRHALPLDRLRETRAFLDIRLRALKGQNGIRAEEYWQYDIIYVTWDFDKIAIDLRIVFDAACQGATVLFEPW